MTNEVKYTEYLDYSNSQLQAAKQDYEQAQRVEDWATETVARIRDENEQRLKSATYDLELAVDVRDITFAALVSAVKGLEPFYSRADWSLEDE